MLKKQILLGNGIYLCVFPFSLRETRCRVSSSAEEQVWRARRRWGRYLRWGNRGEGGEQERLIPERCPAAPRAQGCSSAEILAAFAPGLVFGSATQRDSNVKSSSLNRRNDSWLGNVAAFHEFGGNNNNNKTIKKASGIPKEKLLLQRAGTSPACVQRSAKE